MYREPCHCKEMRSVRRETSERLTDKMQKNHQKQQVGLSKEQFYDRFYTMQSPKTRLKETSQSSDTNRVCTVPSALPLRNKGFQKEQREQ